MSAHFQLESRFQPAGDQPRAIEQLFEGFRDNRSCQVLLGATGTGKTFTASNVVAQLNKPTLVLSHNKTLAAQLYNEFKDFFPRNAVHYFVSYYDYYQPEAYIPQRDIYIEKDASINEDIDRLRLAATSALVSREDVIIVASVSCIYGLGSPDDYKAMMVRVVKGEVIDRDDLLLQTRRYSVPAQRCRLRARQVSRPRRRASKFGRLTRNSPSASSYAATKSTDLAIINPASGETLRQLDRSLHLPGQALRHARGPHSRRRRWDQAASWKSGLQSCASKASCSKPSGSSARTRFDIEMMHGSRPLPRHRELQRAGSRAASRASRPTRCIDFFPEDFLLVVDESHVTLPQIAGDVRRRPEPQDRRSWSTASACPARSTTGRCKFDEWEQTNRSRSSVHVRDAGTL